MSGVPGFKDLFSTASDDYARYRPVYPPELTAWVAEEAPGRAIAWDVGTGNGQNAVALAAHFGRVIATDPSAAQINTAAKNDHVEYRVEPAETSTLRTACADAVCVAQAFHWFKQQAFFSEVNRVLKPGGILAFWAYGLCRITPEVDRAVLHFYNETLQGDWEPERRLVDEGYALVQLPFAEVTAPSFAMTAQWGLDEFLGYLGTWSAVKTHRKRTGTDPLPALRTELEKAWGPAAPRAVVWDLGVRAGRKAS
jgi:ubiquinone/menaquinone biosynthesis C-methylase UbiE